MHRVIVSDTSCLILLHKLNHLDLLQKLFKEITITDVIAKEFGEELPDFIKKDNPKDKNYQRILESFLDSGEASALALAIEHDDCLLILDDYKARKEAKQLSLNFTGTIGILILAIDKGFIQSSVEIIEKIKQTDFRISEKYLNEIIKRTDK